MLIAIGAIMGLSTNGSFVIGYLTMTCAILTVGTISYDEFDNGYPFLFTLPITQKTYVTGKYIFCILGGLIGWCVSVVVFICCTLIKGGAFSAPKFFDTAAFIPVFALIIALMLPIQLKYGAEKGRIVIIVIGGSFWAIEALLMKHLPDDLQLPALLSNLDKQTATIAFVIFSLAALVVSYFISLHIMEKKEY